MVVYTRSLATLRENKTIWREAKPGAKEIMERCRSLFMEENATNKTVEKGLREWYQSLPANHPSKKLSRYKNIDKYSPKHGPWRDHDISWPGGGGPRYDVIHPVTKQPCVVPEPGWRFSRQEAMERQIALGLVEFRKDHTEPPFRKAHLVPVIEELDEEDSGEEEIEYIETDDESESEAVGMQVRPSVIYKQSQVAVKYLRGLMGEKIFNNPKDHEELAKLIRYCTSSTGEDIILDFFAGSGSTAEAVLKVNTEDKSNRRFICVQLPETTRKLQKNGSYKESAASKAGFSTIADICRERVQRAAQRLNNADNGRLPYPDVLQQDRGFKAFSLAESNFKVWDADAAYGDGDKLAHQLELYAEHRLPDRSAEDVLYELLLKSGRSLTAPIVERNIAGQKVYDVDAGQLLICLEDPISEDTLRGMIEQKPERVLCLDSAFEGNDQLKTNILLQMRDAEIEFRTV